MTPNSVAAQQKLHVKRWIKKVNSAYFSKETLIILRTPVKIKQIMEMDGNGLLQFFFCDFMLKRCAKMCFRCFVAFAPCWPGPAKGRSPRSASL